MDPRINSASQDGSEYYRSNRELAANLQALGLLVAESGFRWPFLLQ